MTPSQPDERRVFAATAFGLFIAGLLIPFVIAALGAGGPAAAFAAVAQVLALVFGFIGRRMLMGKVAVAGAAFALVIAGLSAALASYRFSLAEQEARQQMEDAREQVEQLRNAFQNDRERDEAAPEKRQHDE